MPDSIDSSEESGVNDDGNENDNEDDEDKDEIEEDDNESTGDINEAEDEEGRRCRGPLLFRNRKGYIRRQRRSWISSYCRPCVYDHVCSSLIHGSESATHLPHASYVEQKQSKTTHPDYCIHYRIAITQ